jgi:RNA-directed DNA polymerase
MADATRPGGCQQTQGHAFMLDIRQLKHLAHRLEVLPERLEEVAESPERWCEELLLNDPAKPQKQRTVLNIFGPLRKMQDRMLRGILLPKLSVSDFSHGGVRGRHIKSNVQPHLKSVFVFTTDISNFYPTVSHNRIYRLFVGDFGCSPDVARICTKLCTYKHHLALGLITSPILADQVMRPIDARIGGACRKAGLVYTRYVDDLTISGSFDLQESGFSALVERILGEHGFEVNPSKHCFGCLADGVPITKIRVSRGHLDVRKEYFSELERQIADAARLASGGDFEGPYYTDGQIWGRVQFVCWVNSGRRRGLLRKFRAVNWKAVAEEARGRSLIATKKTLQKR